MNEMSSGDEYNAELMPTGMLEEIHDGSQSHPSINSIYVRYKIHNHMKQRRKEWK